MKETKHRILFVEDDKVDQMAFERFATQEDFPYDYVTASSIKEAKKILEKERFDVAVADYLLGDGTAFDLFDELKDIPTIIVTGAGNEEIAVKAMEAGAYDYLIKDPEGNYLKTLPITVDNALNRRRTEEELLRYREHLEELVKIRTVELQKEIDERKRAEEALRKAHDELEMRVQERTAELSRANEELARASRLKDEFLATMSHELRTPLNAVLGMSESLQEEVYGPINERQLKAVCTIEESGRHLLALINDILDLSKIEAGKMELEIGKVYVESVCRASLQFIKQAALKKRLKISSMFDNNVTTIRADERRMKQILVNLLNNAVKFTPEDGSIGLEVEGEPEHHVVRFTVWDTGIGIPHDKIEHLFQPFIQLDSTFSRRYEGAGLGLSLVYRMVEMHGGSISVESEVGKGSRFIVSLPWKDSKDGEIGSLGDRESIDRAPHFPISPLPHLPISPPPQSRTILIADDNEGTIQTLSTYLEAKGYQLTIARDGKEAIARTKEEHPDLILMDIQMPEINGLEAIRYIRTNEHMQSIPIIAVTALAMPGDRERCLEAGANEYLSKPLILQKLSEILERLLANREKKE